MKILATSDLHGNLDNLCLDNIDAAFLAGDIAPLKGLSKWHKHDQLKWMQTKFHDFCTSWSDVEIVFIPGNHDFFTSSSSLQPSADISKVLNLASNAHLLVDSILDINGLHVYGTPWVPTISHCWAFEADSSLLKEKFAKIPHGLDILLSHTPPRLNYVDVSLDHGVNSEKFGSYALAEAVIDAQPKMCFCGHIHSGDHNMNMLGNTQVWNVSRVNEMYEIAYDPLVLEI